MTLSPCRHSSPSMPRPTITFVVCTSISVYRDSKMMGGMTDNLINQLSSFALAPSCGDMILVRREYLGVRWLPRSYFPDPNPRHFQHGSSSNVLQRKVCSITGNSGGHCLLCTFLRPEISTPKLNHTIVHSWRSRRMPPLGSHRQV